MKGIVRRRSDAEVYSDVLTLLLVLRALDRLGLISRRLKLQKIVYFAKLLGTIRNKPVTHHEFYVWKFGPFSKQIYSDLEYCVANGLLKAIPLEDHNEETDEKAFEYHVTENGRSSTELALQESEFQEKYDTILRSLQHTGALSSDEIRRLSYVEADFKQASKQGKTTPIDSRFPNSRRMVALAKEVALKEGMRLSDDEAAFMYFSLLESLARQ